MTSCTALFGLTGILPQPLGQHLGHGYPSPQSATFQPQNPKPPTGVWAALAVSWRVHQKRRVEGFYSQDSIRLLLLKPHAVKIHFLAPLWHALSLFSAKKGFKGMLCPKLGVYSSLSLTFQKNLKTSHSLCNHFFWR